jgi:hypothetical protein
MGAAGCVSVLLQPTRRAAANATMIQLRMNVS